MNGFVRRGPLWVWHQSQYRIRTDLSKGPTVATLWPLVIFCFSSIDMATTAKLEMNGTWLGNYLAKAGDLWVCAIESFFEALSRRQPRWTSFSTAHWAFKLWKHIYLKGWLETHKLIYSTIKKGGVVYYFHCSNWIFTSGVRFAFLQPEV